MKGPTIENPLLPHTSKTGMLLITSIFHPTWPIQFMMVYRPDGKLDVARLVFHDGSNIVLDIPNVPNY